MTRDPRDRDPEPDLDEPEARPLSLREAREAWDTDALMDDERGS